MTRQDSRQLYNCTKAILISKRTVRPANASQPILKELESEYGSHSGDSCLQSRNRRVALQNLKDRANVDICIETQIAEKPRYHRVEEIMDVREDTGENFRKENHQDVQAKSAPSTGCNS